MNKKELRPKPLITREFLANTFDKWIKEKRLMDDGGFGEHAKDRNGKDAIELVSVVSVFNTLLETYFEE